MSAISTTQWNSGMNQNRYRPPDPDSSTSKFLLGCSIAGFIVFALLALAFVGALFFMSVPEPVPVAPGPVVAPVPPADARTEPILQGDEPTRPVEE